MKKILIGLLLATNIVTMAGCTKTKAVGKETEVVEEAKEKAETKVPKYKVTLEDGTYDSSGFAYYVYGTLTNNKKDVDYIQILIPVYDKNGNKLGDAMANCNNLKKGETWRFKAMALEDGIAKFGKDVEVTGF